MGRVVRIAKRFRAAVKAASKASRSTFIKNLYRIGTGVGSSGVVGLAADVAATVYRGTKRASDIVKRDEVRAKRRIDMSAAMDEGYGPVVVDPNSVGYSQKKRVRAKGGSNPSKLDKMMKRIGALTDVQICRFQGLSDQIWVASGTEQYPGYYPLGYYLSNVANSNAVLPYYMFDLTTALINRSVNTSGAANDYYGVPFYRLSRYNGFNDKFNYQQISGRDSDNSVDQYRWQVERTADLITNTPRNWGDKMYLEWADIRMQIYGARKAPTRVFVDIIQFTEEEYCPRKVIVDTSGAQHFESQDASETASTDPALFARWQNFHVAEVDRLLGNSIAKRGVKMPRGYNVLFSKIFDFEPVMTTEGDACPHNVQFELKYYIDKVINYVEKPQGDTLITTAEMIQPNEWDTSDYGKTLTSCNPKGRVYLRIRGEALKNEFTNTAEDKICDYAASFDLMVRRKNSMIKQYTQV